VVEGVEQVRSLEFGNEKKDAMRRARGKIWESYVARNVNEKAPRGCGDEKCEMATCLEATMGTEIKALSMTG
jgi:hypothetical protein